MSEEKLSDLKRQRDSAKARALKGRRAYHGAMRDLEELSLAIQAQKAARRQGAPAGDVDLRLGSREGEADVGAPAQERVGPDAHDAAEDPAQGYIGDAMGPAGVPILAMEDLDGQGPEDGDLSRAGGGGGQSGRQARRTVPHHPTPNGTSVAGRAAPPTSATLPRRAGTE